jgi:uncharacterized protein
MGHCDSSAQFGRHGQPSGSGRGAIEAFPRRDAQPISSRAAITRYPQSISMWILLTFLRIYKAFLSPFFGGACKYHPSCSNYAYEAIERHGARRGVVLALKRLLRCRPFVQGGFDPVPNEEKMHLSPVPQSRVESF